MRVWQFILCLIVCFLISYILIGSKEKQPETVVERTNVDSLKNALVDLQKDYDSLQSARIQTQKGAEIIKIRYHEKDNSLKYISADSSLKLFGQWNGQLQDSSYQKRYFRINSDTIR